MQKGQRDGEKLTNEWLFVPFLFQSACVLFTCVCHSVYQRTWLERPYSVNQISSYYYFNMILKILHMYTMYHDYVHFNSSPLRPFQLHIPSNIIPSFLIRQLISPLSPISNMTIPLSQAKKFPSKAMIFPAMGFALVYSTRQTPPVEQSPNLIKKAVCYLHKQSQHYCTRGGISCFAGQYCSMQGPCWIKPLKSFSPQQLLKLAYREGEPCQFKIDLFTSWNQTVMSLIVDERTFDLP